MTQRHFTYDGGRPSVIHNGERIMGERLSVVVTGSTRGIGKGIAASRPSKQHSRTSRRSRAAARA
jgi:hypothetical protein